MTKGEQIIGTFNTESRSDVDRIKSAAINLVNIIEKVGKDPRRKAAAITDVEKATAMALRSF